MSALRRIFQLIGFAVLFISPISNQAQYISKPLPEKVVILTFDDAIATQYSVVAPLLKKYGFGATFFVCEFPPDFDNKSKYMSWQQIRKLHQMDFEVANHTRTHVHIGKITPPKLEAELAYIDSQCVANHIPVPQTFAYPGYGLSQYAPEVFQKKGYTFARAGGNRPYRPNSDHPYLLPSFSTSGDDADKILSYIKQAKQDEIVILTIHGVPDKVHSWVNTPPELFEKYLRYMKENHYKVWSLQKLSKYIDTQKAISEIEFKIE